MILIFPFTSSEIPPLDQVGGKALALMQMTSAGMPVPPGLVLSVKFFEPWLARLQNSPAWAALKDPTISEVSQAAKALQDACAELQLTAGQQEELENALSAFREKTPGQFYAVRSSSPEEDLEGASFAGGYETSLGVTAENLAAAILRSFSSSFDDRVFLYKKEHGFRIDQPRIAVIVQQQVNAESAGVAFSLNPLNNCYDEIVINANFGLGESVVSGEAEPDVFVIDKIKHAIIQTRIGEKQTVITLDQNGGVTKTSSRKRSEPSVMPAQALQLTRLLAQVEEYYQQPVDIEWAISKGELFLLQARPITTYLPLPDEMLTAPGEPKRLYANSTLIEQGMQQPLSVLGTNFLTYLLKNVGGSIGVEAIGPDGITFSAGGGYYMNLSYALKLGMGSASLAPGSFGDPGVTAILDSIEMSQYLAVELPDKLKTMRGRILINALPMITSALKAYLRPNLILQNYLTALPGELQRLETFNGSGLSLEAQASELSALLQFFFGENGIPMILAAQIAQRRIHNLFKREAGQVQEALVSLGVALPGNKTTEMGELMYALASADEISRFESAADFIKALAEKRLSSEFMQAWEHFMNEFGMRCPGEIDPATPRPKEQPALFFEQLKDMSLANHSREDAYADAYAFFEAARAKRQAAYQTLYAIALKKGRRKASALEKYYQTWLTFGGYRETPKHYVIKVVDLFRRQALALGQAFTAEGRLDRPEQIFDLTIADIDRAGVDPALDLRALAQERSALINKIKKNKRAVRIIDSRGKIYDPPRKAAADGELSGTPISPGLAQGRVKVFHYAHEKKLLPGEILVARAADPGWTPLFINAGGIILEIGGALQHGAVVAREYGIPCVSGLDDATRLLKDGQMVEIDGLNGIVRVLD